MSPKKSGKTALSPSHFRLTGGSAKLKTVVRDQRAFYFRTKVDADEAADIAMRAGAEALGVGEDDVKVGRPALKYEFYCMCDAEVMVHSLHVKTEEVYVPDETVGVLVVGEKVLLPRKTKSAPMKSVVIDTVHLHETRRPMSVILNGTTGLAAQAMEEFLKGPGKKKATPEWLDSVKVAPGKLNSFEKVIRALEKEAKKVVPAGAKRVAEHELTVKLTGFYVPTYYVKVSAGEESKTMRVNAVTGDVALKV